MFVDTFITKTLHANMRAANEADAAKHTPSGKLSAGSLGDALQWQVLKALAIGVRVIDDATLLKFLRGKHVEEWFVGTQLPGVVERQKFVTYRGVVGYADAMVDTSVGYDFNAGVIPHEVKSITRDKMKWLNKLGTPDMGHWLQGGLYALATGSSHFALDYVNTSDYRVLSWVFDTEDAREDIDRIITAYDNQMASQVVPAFAPFNGSKWQANPMYNKYPEWQGLTEVECQMAINLHYPNAWKDYEEKKNK